MARYFQIIYLAIPFETYYDFFRLQFIQRMLERYQVKLLIYDPEEEEIRQWIK
ncbi:element excision factor XisH family protein [Cronbergia sp. UHCC 0137]|uniref:element excision factor XisH family protein n=1 Tax=Cronbergia sp. UHCC 0137 TaxID=3110239 RepID=UPI002B1F18D3|nr:element excision factor XisH family protein [Cronbergia sp. UHCC 0137]MEA5617296.1 element excision factor XisH family protein [Cronbergia sp. UHCC 0137]